jgi:ribosomal protein L30/L7E
MLDTDTMEEIDRALVVSLGLKKVNNETVCHIRQTVLNIPD